MLFSRRGGVGNGDDIYFEVDQDKHDELQRLYWSEFPDHSDSRGLLAHDLIKKYGGMSKGSR
ncbi:hypothetical protein GCM10025859_15540 [Alicyclobacillus fastidiosus]|nr:hypothetical protein GCM10025859_15540 [Alicyclobacillus fastidiosus]